MYLPGTQSSAHSKVWRHLECTAHSAASTPQCKAAQLLEGGKPGHFTRMHSMSPAKCTASSVFARGSVHFNSHITPLRQVEEKRHLAKLLVQFPNTQVGLGDKVLSSKGQLSLMQAKVSSTVSPNKVAAAFSCSPRNMVAGAALTMQASLSVPAKAEGESLTSEEPKSCFTGTPQDEVFLLLLWVEANFRFAHTGKLRSRAKPQKRYTKTTFYNMKKDATKIQIQFKMQPSSLPQ